MKITCLQAFELGLAVATFLIAMVYVAAKKSAAKKNGGAL